MNVTTEYKPIAAQSGHFYLFDGTPFYEVQRAKGDGMRPATIKDARKVGAVPSVSLILRCAAQPGLEAWKAQQLVLAALTLPKFDGEALDAYARRVIEDSKEQGRKAAERGTALHTAIELAIQKRLSKFELLGVQLEFFLHVEAVFATLKQYGIDLDHGSTEHSFAHKLGYGGKVDFHSRNPRVIIDFKSKQKIEDGKQLAWDEQRIQLAAYSIGVFDSTDVRALNVFVGLEDQQVRVHEWSRHDLAEAFELFRCLLTFWQKKNHFAIQPEKAAA